jgi:hypothetical protein
MADYYNPPALDGAQDAISKLCRAEKRGTGCRLTAQEVQSLALTSIGQMWNEPDPRKSKEAP